MRIGFNLLYLVPGEVGGTEIYARELIGELARSRPEHEFVVYCGREAAESLPDPRWGDGVRVVPLDVEARSRPRRLRHELLRLPSHARRDGIDLLHSMGQTAPLWGRFARVVTIHDLIFHHYPSTFSHTARRALDTFVPAGARRADRILADSEATAQDLVKTYGIDRESIDVALLGPGFEPPESWPSSDELERSVEFELGEYALCVASTHEHKNVARLLEAFAELDGDRRLVLVGRAASGDDDLARAADSLGLGDRVKFTGWIDDETLEGLYRAARFFVYPTLMEGFGMPVLEAMRRGVPVACSNVSSMPEVAGDAALTFDPSDRAAIAEALELMFTDDNLRSQLAAAGRARSSEFTWARTADATWDCYERAIAQRAA